MVSRDSPAVLTTYLIGKEAQSSLPNHTRWDSHSLTRGGGVDTVAAMTRPVRAEKDLWTGKRTTLTLCVVAFAGIAVGVFATLLGIWLWLGIAYTGERTLVGQASYRVAVPSRPDASGTVYMLGYDDKYLLVLTSRSSEHPEGYYVDPGSRRIGLPDFGKYRRIPFLGCALVNASVYWGFPLDGAFAADWRTANEGKEVRIRITGMVQEEPGGSEEFLKQHMPIAYGNEIVLTRSWE